MAETFHYLLTLDSSVLDRGRDARQFPISAPTAHEDESKHSARFASPTRPACADRLVTLQKSVKTRSGDQPKTRTLEKTIVSVDFRAGKGDCVLDMGACMRLN